MGIYVETRIRGSLEELWQKTQNPALHERWDLRFTRIEYLPRPDESQPQQFLYSTRIGLGVRIDGAGETVGQVEDTQGQRTSALKFWSDDHKSLIQEGTGYWKYIPQADGIRFLTWYDYRTRFGMLGRAFDSVIFRPLLGWATAWSFDRLRLWLEKGIDPALSLLRSLMHGLARLTISLIWVYQGLVPKLLFHHSDELAMLMHSGVSPGAAQMAVSLSGLAEVGLGVVFLLLWSERQLFLLNIGLMVAAAASVSISSPEYLIAAFNPVTLNVAMIALSLIGFLAGVDIPSARRCVRQRPEHAT